MCIVWNALAPPTPVLPASHMDMNSMECDLSLHLLEQLFFHLFSCLYHEIAQHGEPSSMYLKYCFNFLNALLKDGTWWRRLMLICLNDYTPARYDGKPTGSNAIRTVKLSPPLQWHANICKLNGPRRRQHLHNLAFLASWTRTRHSAKLVRKHSHVIMLSLLTDIGTLWQTVCVPCSFLICAPFTTNAEWIRMRQSLSNSKETWTKTFPLACQIHSSTDPRGHWSFPRHGRATCWKHLPKPTIPPSLLPHVLLKICKIHEMLFAPTQNFRALSPIAQLQMPPDEVIAWHSLQHSHKKHRIPAAMVFSAVSSSLEW